MVKKTLFTVFVILMAVACHDEQLDKESISSKTLIKTGTVCGWRTINDTLTISGNSVRYVNYTQCSISNPAVEKNGQIKTSDLEVLLAQLDFSKLKKLDLNSVNIAFDGCDDWVYYDNGTESHYIRFTRNDPKLQPVKEFVDQLNVIKTQYAGSN